MVMACMKAEGGGVSGKWNVGRVLRGVACIIVWRVGRRPPGNCALFDGLLVHGIHKHVAVMQGKIEYFKTSDEWDSM